MNINFIKCHGSGNDFILIDEKNLNYNLNEEERRELAIKLCNREKSIGADGILFILEYPNFDGYMRIFNSDGSEAEMCGNGLRCVGRYVMDKVNKNTALIKTLKAQYKVKKHTDIFDGIYTVEIEMKTVDFNVKSLPMICKNENFINQNIEKFSNYLNFTAVSITNPHIVAFVENFSMDEIKEIGILANNSKEIFPKGVNVNFVKILDSNNIYVKTFERGVGITKSCGTGMTASTVSYCLNNPNCYDKLINIYNDGGSIKIAVNKEKNNYTIKFIGNASYVFTAIINLKNNSVENKTIFEDEVKSYEAFLNNSIKL